MSKGRWRGAQKGFPRYAWEYYGLENKQYRNKLREMCRSGRYDDPVRKAAYQASEELAPYLIKCVTKGKSYDLLEFDLGLGRIFVGKTSFYGILRYFYYLFDLEVKEECDA